MLFRNYTPHSSLSAFNNCSSLLRAPAPRVPGRGISCLGNRQRSTPATVGPPHRPNPSSPRRNAARAAACLSLARPSQPAACPPAPSCSSRSSSSSSSGVRQRTSRPGRQRVVIRAAASQALTAWPAENYVWLPFKPDFYSSQPVQLQGSFNDWSGPIPLNHDPTTGKVGGVLRLEAHHAVISFKYQVGDKWFLSREDAAAADSQGCINNTTAGRQTVRFSFPSAVLSALTGPNSSSSGSSPPPEVHLIGSFTDWQVSIPMTPGPDGQHHADVALTPGHHTFNFIVDAAAGPTRDISSSGSSDFRFTSAGNTGTTHGSDIVPPFRSPSNTLSLSGAKGQRRAQWTVVDWLPMETQPGGSRVNSLRVPPPPTFKVLYHTSLSEAYINYRFKGQESFSRLRLYHQPDCLGLMVAQLPAPNQDSQLEFSIIGVTGTLAGSSSSTSGADGSSNGSNPSGWGAPNGSNGSSGGVSAAGATSPAADMFSGSFLSADGVGVVSDPPAEGQLHVASAPGVWRLKAGQLTLDDAGQLTPLMLCTDLDGTLIEDQADDNDWVRAADDATRQLTKYFGRYLAPCGGVMVFNTGRSIGMVEGLLKKKTGIMPRPHAIITAVGTKVFLWDVATESWVPDPGYAVLLNEGWDAEKVSRLADEMRRRYSGGVSVVDDGSEHPHRLSMSMRADVYERATQKWSEGLTREGVKHQMVASIGGEWRYVDCISAHAGKGRAMMYIASRYGITNADVVAAGDSGNDLLMLGPVDGAQHPAIVMSNSHPEVWEWLHSCTPEERTWVYTPKAERAGGLVEGLKAIVADKLRAHVARQKKLLQRQQQQPKQQRQLPAQRGGSNGGGGLSSSGAPTVRALRG